MTAEPLESNIVELEGNELHIALDVVEKFQPKTVVAGYKDQTMDDDASRVLAQTRGYLTDAGRLLDEGASAMDYFNTITSLHPMRLNTGAAWICANALCPQ